MKKVEQIHEAYEEDDLNQEALFSYVGEIILVLIEIRDTISERVKKLPLPCKRIKEIINQLTK